MHTNYPIFAEYNYYLRSWLRGLMQLPRVTALGLEIPVVYSSPRRAFALGSSELTDGGEAGEPLYSPPNEGNNFLPILTFRINGIVPSLGKTIPYEHVLTYPVQDNNNNIIGYNKSKPMLVYEVGYIATLYTALMQDADILMFKFLTEFKPNANVWIGPCDKAGEPNWGVWAPMILDGVADASEYEPLDIGERVIRKDFSWTIQDTFVPTTESIFDSSIVEEVYADVYAGDLPLISSVETEINE